MKSQYINDDTMRVPNKQSSRAEEVESRVSTKTAVTALEILPILLERLMVYLDERVDSNDAEMLAFCLCQLFYRITLLYQSALPALADATDATIGRDASPDLLSRHRTWAQLRQLTHVLERVESLCHLLDDAAESILEALDVTNFRGRTFTDERQQALNTESEQWEQAYATLAQCLNRWQQYGAQRLSFAIQFAHLAPTLPTLASMDNALDLLLDNASAIFGDIFPDLQAISPGDDEAVATLLFDLMQQCDLLLVHIDCLLEPLHTLMRQYALLAQQSVS